MDNSADNDKLCTGIGGLGGGSVCVCVCLCVSSCFFGKPFQSTDQLLISGQNEKEKRARDGGGTDMVTASCK